MQNLPLSFREWCYPTKHKRAVHCSWGNCGYIAISHKNVITIYKFDGIQYTIYLSWSPYDKAEITAIGWFDGSCAPCESRPIITASFTNGSTLCFDLDDQSVIGKIKHANQTTKSIKWSPYNPNEFYMGTEDGQFSIYELTTEGENTIVKLRERFSFDFPIDFISIDKLNGSTIVAASKNGKIAYIKDLYQIKNSRYTKQNVHSSAEKSQYYVKRKLRLSDNSNIIINSIEFLPGQYAYLLISTNDLSYIHLLTDGISLPFIGTKGIKYIYPFCSKNHFYVISKGLIELWSYHYDSLNPVGDLKKLYSMEMKVSDNSDIECYDFLNDKMIIFTKSSWLTLVEEKKEKLFITQRSRMMPPKPIDWDFRDSQIAFLTSDGQVILTEKVDNINLLKDVPKRDSLHFYIPPPPSPPPEQINPVTETPNQVSSEKVPSFSNPSGASDFRTAFDPSVMKVPGAADLNRKRAQSFQADQNKYKPTDSEFSTATLDLKDSKKKARKDSNVKEAPKKTGGFFSFFKGKNKDKAKPKKKGNEPEPEGDTLFDLDGDDEADIQPAEKNDHENDEIDSEDDLLDAFENELTPQKGKEKVVTHSTSNSSLNSASTQPTGSSNQPANVDEIELFCSHSPTQSFRINTLIQTKYDARIGNSMSFTNSFTTDPNRFHFDSHLYFSHIYNTVSSMTVTTTTINENGNEGENENESTENNNNENNDIIEKTEKEFSTTITTIGAIDVSTSVNDYMIDTNWKLNVQHLKWISKNKILAWGSTEGKNSLVLINIKTRKVVNLMKKQLDSIKKPITDIKFSKDMKIAFISFGERFIAFFRLCKPFPWIGAIKVKKESIGDFSPDYLKTDFFDNVNAVDDDDDENENDNEDDENENSKESNDSNIDFGLGNSKSKNKEDLKKVYLAAFLSEGLTLTVVKINKSRKTPIKTVFERTFKISKSTPSSFLWKGKIEKQNTSLYQKYNNKITDEDSESNMKNKFYMFLGSKEGRLFRIDFTNTFNIIRNDDKNVNQNDILITQLAAVSGGAITSISPLLLPDRKNKLKEFSRDSVVTSFENLNELSRNDKSHTEEDQEEEDENNDIKNTQKNKEKANIPTKPSPELENIDNFFVITNSGQAFLVKNGKQFEMKSHAKKAKFATDLTMLVRFSKSGTLSRVEFTSSPRSVYIKATSKILNAYDRKVNLDLVIGDGSYSLPPVTFRPQTNFIYDVKKQKSIEDMINVCHLYGQNYVAHALELIVNNHTNLEYLTDFWFLRFLNKSRFYSDQFFKSALFASKLDLAHRVLMDTEPDNPQYILNMTRASFFDMPLLIEKARQQLVEANEEYEKMKKKVKEIERQKKLKKKNQGRRIVLVNKEKEVTRLDDDGNEVTEIVVIEEEEEVNEEEEEPEKKKTIDEVLEIDSVVVENVKNRKETVQLFGNKMEAALKAMISTGRNNDAVETLLIIGQVSRAVELLLKNSNFREAALLSSMWPLAPFVMLNRNYDDGEEEEDEDKQQNNVDIKILMMDVAEKFCKEGGFLLAISLLTGAGMNKEAIEMVTKNVEAFPRIIKGIHIENMDDLDENNEELAEDAEDVNDWV